MKKILPISLFLLVCSFAWSQQVAFRLLLHSGNVHVKNGMEVRTAAAGLLIYPDENIMIGQNGYMAIVHVSGSILELKEPGLFRVNDLEQLAESVDAYPHAMRYAEIASGNMSPESKKNRLVASAYEMRDAVEVQRKIRLYIPSAVKVLNERVFLRWETVENATFDVIIRDMHDRVLVREKVRENEIFIDLSIEDLRHANILLVHIEVEGVSEVSSETYALKRVSDTDRIELEEEMRDVASGTNSAELLILAGFYESKNLLADAQQCYYEALKMAPGVRGYRDAYEEFLMRNHLVRF